MPILGGKSDDLVSILSRMGTVVVLLLFVVIKMNLALKNPFKVRGNLQEMALLWIY